MIIANFLSKYAEYGFYSGQIPVDMHPSYLQRIQWGKDTIKSTLDPDRLKVLSGRTELGSDFFEQSKEGIYVSAKAYLSGSYNIGALLDFVNESQLDSEGFTEKKAIVYKCIAMHIKQKPREISTFHYTIQLVGLFAGRLFGHLDFKPMLSAIFHYDRPLVEPICSPPARSDQFFKDLKEFSDQSIKKAIQATAFIQHPYYTAFSHAVLGEFYASMDDFESARKQFRLALEAIDTMTREGVKADERNSISFLEEFEPDSRQDLSSKAWAFVACAQSKAGFSEWSLETFSRSIELIDEKWLPYYRNDVVKFISEVQLDAGLMDRAIETARLSDQFTSDDVLLSLSKKQVKAGQYDDALQITKEVNDDCLRCKALAFIVRELKQNGMKELADQTEDQLSDLLYDINEANGELIDVLAEICIVPEGWRDFIPSQLELVGAGLKEQDDYVFSKALARAGFFDKAIEVVKRISDWPSDTLKKAKALRIVSIELAKAGEFDRAIEMARSIPDSIPRIESDPLLSISVLLAKAGEFDRAIEIAFSCKDQWGSAPFRIKGASGHRNQLLERGDAGQPLTEISMRLAESGDFKRAYELAVEIPSPMHRIAALLRIVEFEAQNVMSGSMGTIDSVTTQLKFTIDQLNSIQPESHSYDIYFKVLMWIQIASMM